MVIISNSRLLVAKHNVCKVWSVVTQQFVQKKQGQIKPLEEAKNIAPVFLSFLILICHN